MTLALLKETIMAKELAWYAKCHEWDEADTEDLFNKAATYALYQRGEDWWICQAIQEDGHKYFDLMSSFDWEETEEGDEYWRMINRFVSRDPAFNPEG